MTPKISIIIPVYNVEDYLQQCLESVINQTFKDIEIIVVNDGSTDNSLEIIEEYKKRDSRIILLNQKNCGPGNARNSGLDISKGEYILFIDSDDWIKEETTQELYEIVKNDKNIDLIIFQYMNYDDEKDIFYEQNFDSKLNKFVDKSFQFKDISNYYLFPGCVNKLYKKSLIDDNDIRFPEKLYLEDKPFYTEIILKADKIYFTDKEYYIRRRREGSITAKADDKIYDSVEISNLIVKAYQKHDKYSEYMKSVINNKISYLRYWYRTILDEYKQDYLKLLAKDFDNIKNNKKSYEVYLSCLEGINYAFFIKVDENIKFQDLDYLLSEYRIKTKITLNPLKTAVLGQKIQITGTLSTFNDNIIPHAQIRIYINNSPKTLKVDEKGNFNLTTQINKTGTHDIIIQYQGNNTYEKTQTNTTIQINKKETKITLNPIGKVIKGDEIVLRGSLATYNCTSYPMLK